MSKDFLDSYVENKKPRKENFLKLKLFGKIVGSLMFCCIILFFGSYIYSLYETNYKYSIAMPTILGRFDIENNNITIWGIENIVGDDIATLNYNEFTCYIPYKICSEKRVVVMGLGNQISIFPYNDEYKITYRDKNKIIIASQNKNISGEIDLNMKTISFTIPKAGFAGKPRKIEILTDNRKIEELEKKIIHKHLKKKLLK